MVSATSAMPVTTTSFFWVLVMSDHDFFAMASHLAGALRRRGAR